MNIKFKIAIAMILSSAAFSTYACGSGTMYAGITANYNVTDHKEFTTPVLTKSDLKKGYGLTGLVGLNLEKVYSIELRYSANPKLENKTASTTIIKDSSSISLLGKFNHSFGTFDGFIGAGISYNRFTSPTGYTIKDGSKSYEVLANAKVKEISPLATVGIIYPIVAGSSNVIVSGDYNFARKEVPGSMSLNLGFTTNF